MKVNNQRFSIVQPSSDAALGDSRSVDKIFRSPAFVEVSGKLLYRIWSTFQWVLTVRLTLDYSSEYFDQLNGTVIGPEVMNDLKKIVEAWIGIFTLAPEVILVDSPFNLIEESYTYEQLSRTLVKEQLESLSSLLSLAEESGLSIRIENLALSGGLA